MRFEIIFLIGYSIVHYQIPLLTSIGIEPRNPEFIWINKEVVNYAIWMSTVAIVLWMLGSMIKLKKNTNQNQSINYSQIQKVNLHLYDFILAVVFVIFLILVGRSFFAGIYDGGNSWGDGANYAYLILKILLYLRIIYFFNRLPRNISLKSIFFKFIRNYLFASIATIYLVLFLISGDRGPIMQVALIALGAYSLYIKPIKLRTLLIITLIGAFIFTIIGYGRGSEINKIEEGNIFQRGYASFAESQQGINVTNELASSIRIQYRALDVIPEKHPYLNGITFLTVGAGVIPFFSSFIIDLFEIPPQYISSSTFFTILGQGNNPKYGEGSEILSDIYINFGTIGVFVIMFLFGNISSYLFYHANMLKINYVLILLILIIYGISINRGMLFTPLKDTIYILFFNFLFTKVLK